MTPAQKSIRFFIMMLATLLARVSPASTRANPACMKMTNTAANRTKVLSRNAWTCGAVTSSWATAGPAKANTRPPPTPAATNGLRNLIETSLQLGRRSVALGSCLLRQPQPTTVDQTSRSPSAEGRNQRCPARSRLVNRRFPNVFPSR